MKECLASYDGPKPALSDLGGLKAQNCVFQEIRAKIVILDHFQATRTQNTQMYVTLGIFQLLTDIDA